MVVAKNEWAHDKLSSMISKKEIERKYLAIVSGVIKHETGTIDGTLFPNRISYINHIKNGDILKVIGTVQKRLDKYQIVINKIELVKL